MTTTMRMRHWCLGWGFVFAGMLLGTAAPAAAEMPRAVLYDVTQTAKVVGKRHPQRVAEGALAGRATLGSPLCPDKLASKLPDGATECWITAIGFDTIDLTTGQGTLAAVIIPVTTGEDENPYAAPQLAIEKMNVKGTIDFSPVFDGFPFGTVQGRVDGRHRFTGQFLQPVDGSLFRPFFCDGQPRTAPSSPPGSDWIWIDPAGTCIDIEPGQMSLGYPTLRFDLFFE